MRGWANYFKHAVCKHTLGNLANFAWWPVARWLRTLHRWKWKDLRRRFTTPDGRWKPIAADGIELFNLESVAVTRYRWRGNTIPNPGPCPTTPDGKEPRRARCGESRTPGSASSLGKRTGSNASTARQADSTEASRLDGISTGQRAI
jgi:hypothetical protein